nr:immunoglobulin heavy chain junction region [Macaca mulatta]MOX38760.1 immunoglobulin heavy chain junction region [Macaca mulatta]
CARWHSADFDYW